MSDNYTEWHPGQHVADAAERYRELIAKKHQPRLPNFTPAEAEQIKAARALTCPEYGGMFRHLIDNQGNCARCGAAAATIITNAKEHAA